MPSRSRRAAEVALEKRRAYADLRTALERVSRAEAEMPESIATIDFRTTGLDRPAILDTTTRLFTAGHTADEIAMDLGLDKEAVLLMVEVNLRTGKTSGPEETS